MSNLKDEKSICSICLNDKKLINVKCCKSFYHEECLNLWYKNNNTCPTCRTETVTEESSEIRYYGVDGGVSSISFDTSLNFNHEQQQNVPYLNGINISFSTPQAIFNTNDIIENILKALSRGEKNTYNDNSVKTNEGNSIDIFEID